MPASEIRTFEVTIPAGTPISDPYVLDIGMPAREVVEIDVKVPPGPRGQMGFAIWSSGLTVIPSQTGEFIVTDDEEIAWPLQDQLNSGGWQVAGYNLGGYDHTIYVRFQVAPVATTGGALTAPPIPAAALSSGG